MHIRKDDQVEVITGDDAGTPSHRRIAKVLRVIPERHKIVVEGVNRVYKHLKLQGAAKNQAGWRLSKEMPIAVSNVKLYCPSSCKRGVRIGHRFTDAEGRKLPLLQEMLDRPSATSAPLPNRPSAVKK